ncbi:VOC family protein [Mastigocoleus sp. MO_188.B34]|uniref:VOC family protein n=1 Tax=Mastigocoleus sp. MO_188.B34 TaxID=3036635 RepID=UPI0034571D88
MTIQINEALVTIATIKLERIIDFYTQILGQQPKIYIPKVYAKFQVPGVNLGIFRPKDVHLSEFNNAAKGKISLCLEVSNLENAISRFTALGYPPPGEIITASHGREIYAYDPDGNRIILHQSIENPSTENGSIPAPAQGTIRHGHSKELES